MASTRVRRHIDAPRESVYSALTDPSAITQWKVPSGMTCQVHEFDGRVGGAFRISLTYDDPSGIGKTTGRTDTYRGRFVELVLNERVVEVDEFETDDLAMRGEMTITIALSDANGGTDVFAVHDGLPPGLAEEANEAGWREALARLAALVEAQSGSITNRPRVLFVCAGNTCRSVLAEYLGRAFHGRAATFESVGIQPQRPPDAANAIQTLRHTFGIDASSHLPRDVRALDLEEFDLIVAFGNEVAKLLDDLRVPASRVKVWNVQDPWGPDLSEYDRAALVIRQKLAKLVTSGASMHKW